MKRKLTASERQSRRKRKRETMIIFINGKQKRVPREPLIDGIPVDEFIERNADPIWLHQNEMWELMEPNDGLGFRPFCENEPDGARSDFGSDSAEIPF
jgi:hypothetical protein